jgi:transcriptional regulator with XRE-family HTH domain
VPLIGDDPRMNPGECIRQLREARNLSIAELQRLLGVAWSTVNNWEKKGVVPDRSHTLLLVEKLALTEAESRALFNAVNLAPPSTAAPTPPSPGRGASSGVRVGRPAPSALDEAIDRVIKVPERHKLADGIEVLNALSEAADAIRGLEDTEKDALAWLDAAALLRSRGIPVTAATLAVILPSVVRATEEKK